MRDRVSLRGPISDALLAFFSFRWPVYYFGDSVSEAWGEFCVPVLVSLLALVVLRAVLRLCGKLVRRRRFQRLIATHTGHCDGLLGSKGYESASFGVGVQYGCLTFKITKAGATVREKSHRPVLAGLRRSKRLHPSSTTTKGLEDGDGCR